MKNILCTRNSLVWLLLAVFNLVVSSFAYAQVVVPDGNVAFVIASEDDVTPTLTEREDAVVYKLEVLGYTDITYIAPAKLADADFSKARFVIATEENSLDEKTINSLLEAGKGLVLLYNAAIPFGGNWANQDLYFEDWSGYLYIEKDGAFLKGYLADLSFDVQLNVKENYAYYIQSAYPAGWTILGRNIYKWGTDYKTTFYREHASGGKGVIFTYNPQFYTEAGENVFEKIIEWVAEPPIVKGVTVPEGNVAFVTPWMTDVGLKLTSREMSVQDRLKAMDYNKITYIPLGKLNASDLSKAKLVVAVEYPSLDANTINTLIENGQSVVLFYDAGAPLSPRGKWTSGGGPLYVEKGEKFLEGYASDVSLHVGGGIYLDDRYPLDWTALGRTTSEAISKKTAFYREHASGGRGVIFTYNPESLTWRGESIFNAVIQWATKSLTITPVEVPEGDVAFIITSYDEVVLTDRETIVSDKLKFLGYKITYVCFNRIAVSDFSKSRFVIATESLTLNPNTTRTLLESGKGVVLLYNAAIPFGGNWANQDLYFEDWSGYLYIEKDGAFLKGYLADLSFDVQLNVKENYAYYIQSAYPAGWTILGRNIYKWGTDYKTTFYREHASGGKGVIFTYNPQFYTEAGENVFEKIIEWVAEPPIVKGVTVPEGNVAFVTPWMTDIGLRLTSQEVSVQDKLKAMDYKITYVPISRLKVSDLSKAKFIIGVEYPSLDADTLNFLLETGKGVVLLYDAAGPLAGEWEFSSSGNGHKLLVSKGEAFLEDYEADTSIDVQSDGGAGYIPKGYPLGWTFVGKNTEDIAHMTTFYQQHTSGGRGAIFTYDAEHYTEKGEEIFEKIIEWVSQALPDQVPAIPVLSSPTYGSIIGTDTPTLKWLPVGGATSYTVRIATDSEFTDLVIEQSDITTTQYAVPSGKLKDKIYYWKVNASNSAGTGAWSNTWAFSKNSCVPISEFPRWDVNADGVVDISDLVLVGKHFGEDDLTIKAIASLSETGVFSGETADVRINVQNKVDFQGLRLLRVDINIEPVEDLYGLQFDLSFDPKVLRVVGTQSGDLLAQDGASTYWNVSEIDNQAGRIVDATYVRKATKNGLNASGTLATVVFEVKDFNISGATRLNLNNVKLADANARLIKAITKSTLLNWEELLVPEKSRLLPNYPNPFNPETWLPYQLAQEANVTIRIYNTKGQLVRTIELGRKTAGIYMTQDKAAYWDGRSSYGEKVASGVYYYTLQAGEFRATRKMVIMK